MNYLLVVFWWPSVMLLWEKNLRGAVLCGCCIQYNCCPCAEAESRDQKCCSSAFWTTKPQPHPTPLVTTATREEGGQPERKRRGSSLTDVDAIGGMYKFFNRVYAPALTYHVGGSKHLKPVSLLLILVWGGIGIALVAEAAQMTPPVKSEVWFPTDHMLMSATDDMRENFMASDDASYAEGWLYFGLEDLDASGFDRFDPAVNRGDVVYDAAFDLEDAAAQAQYLSFCDAVSTAACGLEACSRPPHTLVYETRCFLSAFTAEYGGAANLPTGAAFTSELRAWLNTDAGMPYQDEVGFVDGTIKFVSIYYVTTMPRLQPSFKVRPVYELFLELIDEQLATAPPTLATAFAYTGREFTWMGTQESLVRGVFVGFAICFPVAFLVLFVATGSLLVSTFAIATIALVVGSLLGFVSAFLGWDLGTGEAIAATIVIGLSVDYTVHLGHMYVDSEDESREGKLTASATNMGVTVVAGGVTTLGAAVFMFACQLTFFSKMATLIAGTIAFSLLYSLLFFMPLCAVLGPQGRLYSFKEHLMRCAGKDVPARQADADAKANSTADAKPNAKPDATVTA